nr:uncharacterized protein CTRU02_13066 [Colletotrichum truncatum]KAF6783816.1 hypothetical protein CTRU02_13066 [Colletotrichum truncatum]
MNIEAALADVPAEVRQALLRFDSRRDSDLGNGTIFGNLDFKTTEVDLLLPTRIEDSTAPPLNASNNTVHVSVHKPQVINDVPLHIEAVESFSPVSPSDFFQLSPPSISDTFDPLPDVNSVPSSVPNLTKDVAVPSESLVAKPSCSAGNQNELPTGGRSQPLVDDDEWSTPLLAAAARGHAGMGEKGKEWIHKTDRRNRTPLYLAAEMGKTEIAELFIKAGADINRR